MTHMRGDPGYFDAVQGQRLDFAESILMPDPVEGSTAHDDATFLQETLEARGYRIALPQNLSHLARTTVDRRSLLAADAIAAVGLLIKEGSLFIDEVAARVVIEQCVRIQWLCDPDAAPSTRLARVYLDAMQSMTKAKQYQVGDLVTQQQWASVLDELKSTWAAFSDALDLDYEKGSLKGESWKTTTQLLLEKEPELLPLWRKFCGTDHGLSYALIYRISDANRNAQKHRLTAMAGIPQNMQAQTYLGAIHAYRVLREAVAANRGLPAWDTDDQDAAALLELADAAKLILSGAHEQRREGAQSA